MFFIPSIAFCSLDFVETKHVVFTYENLYLFLIFESKTYWGHSQQKVFLYRPKKGEQSLETS